MGHSQQQPPARGQRCLILFGAPGSGKGTQAKLLKNCLGWAHISTGDMLREHVAKKTKIGERIAEMMRTGTLIPDEIVNSLVAERILREDCREGFILDGYPRTVPQADLLVRTMRTNGLEPVVVHLKVDYNIIVARLASRRICSQCGQLYSVASNAPIVTENCDYCGGRLVTREDDKPEVIWKRLEAYDNQTFPVLYFLLGAGYAEHDFDGSDGSPQQIAARISDAVLG
jgi:adenylate kinase